MTVTPAQKLLADIRAKQAERDRLLRELDLWAAVQAQGIAVETVDCWGFEPEWLTPKQKAEAQRAVTVGKPHPYTGERLANGHHLPKVYNFVRLKDGNRVKLDPMLEAVQDSVRTTHWRVDPLIAPDSNTLGDGMTTAKQPGPKKRGKSKPEAITEEKSIIDREVFDWGVRLTAQPFKGMENDALVIRSEIRNYRAGRGSEVLITFPAASMQNPLRLLDAQTWCQAMMAIIAQTRAVQTEMRTAAESVGKKKQRS